VSEDLEAELRRRNRVVAALLGFAVGDAYGVAASRGQQPFSEARADVSDATQIMLACCEGLLRTIVRFQVGSKNPSLDGMVWHAVARWGAAQGDIDLSPEARFAATHPGWLSEQPLMSLRNRHGSAVVQALTSGPGKIESAGSAALFRVAPISLSPGSLGASDVRDVVALTHNSAGGLLAAGVLDRIIRETLNGEYPLRDRVAMVAAGLDVESGGAELGAALLQAISTAPFSPPSSMPGHTAEGTLIRAVRAAARPGSLELALQRVTESPKQNLTAYGSITGLLASLELARGLEPSSAWPYYEFGSGTQLIPADWRDRLLGREVVERMAADLQYVSVHNARINADIVARYPGL
jgi:hypothetical protein